MPELTLNLDEKDREALVRIIVLRVAKEVVRCLQPIIEEAFSPMSSGIRVLGPARVAEQLGKSERHLYRLEASGDLPKRRRIARRRIGYYEHELAKLPAVSVMVRDLRTLTSAQVAAKLGVTEKTLSRLVKDEDMPTPMGGKWLERELDEWLLSRPKVDPGGTSQ